MSSYYSNKIGGDYISINTRDNSVLSLIVNHNLNNSIEEIGYYFEKRVITYQIRQGRARNKIEYRIPSSIIFDVTLSKNDILILQKCHMSNFSKFDYFLSLKSELQIPKNEFQKFNIVCGEKEIKLLENDNISNFKAIQKFENGMLFVKIISNIGSFEVLEKRKGLFELKDITINNGIRPSKKDKTAVNEIMDSVLKKSRENGDFELESVFLNAKLILQEDKENTIIRLFNWENREALNIKKLAEESNSFSNFRNKILENIQDKEKNKQLIIPINFNKHVSVLIVDESRIALFDSSGDCLLNKKPSKEIFTEKDYILNEIIVLNTEDMQTIELEETKKTECSKLYGQLPDIIKNGKLKIENCCYYIMEFIREISNPNNNYNNIAKIQNNIKTIKKNIRDRVEDELKYNKIEVLNKIINNRKNGFYGSEEINANIIQKNAILVDNKIAI